MIQPAPLRVESTWSPCRAQQLLPCENLSSQQCRARGTVSRLRSLHQQERRSSGCLRRECRLRCRLLLPFFLKTQFTTETRRHRERKLHRLPPCLRVSVVKFLFASC